jgi:LacI family transcriptional regulator
MTTIQDVARRAGVSIATASRVLNENTTVNPQLAERVRLAIRELDYRPNAVARSLRRNRSSLWAVIVADIGNPFFTALVRGIEDIAQGSGYSFVLCNSDEDPAKEDLYLRVAAAEKMAGVIISSSGQSRRIHALVESGTPVVAIDRKLRQAEVDTVLVDNERGAQLATEHLAGSGYRRIACISGPRRATTAAERLRGYLSGLRASGLPVDDTLIRQANFREDGGYEAMQALLRLPAPPDAVFASNNLMTIGAVECLVDQSVSIPDQMGVVGFDDIPWAHLVRPSLSTVSQPTYYVGRTAALLLAERIAAPARPPSLVRLGTELAVRESSRPRTSLAAAEISGA